MKNCAEVARSAIAPASAQVARSARAPASAQVARSAIARAIVSSSAGRASTSRLLVLAIAFSAASFAHAMGDAARGRALYNIQCLSCHGGPTNPSPRQATTVTALNNAIRNQNTMGFLNQVLSNQDREDIVAYIVNPTGGADAAPVLNYLPISSLNLSGSPATVGSTASASITATPSAGTGTSTAATTVLGQCQASAGFSASPSSLSFVGSSTTSRTLQVSCTRTAAQQSGTITCQETRGSSPSLSQSWSLTCPAGTVTGAAPQLSYGIAPGTLISLQSSNLVVGSLATAPFNVTPAAGSAALSTTLSCSTSGAVGVTVGKFDLNFVGNTTTVQSYNLACSRATAAQNGTLTCAETRGSAAAIINSWPIVCPAAATTAAATQAAYYPSSTGTLPLTGSPNTAGSKASGFVQIQPFGGAGEGADNASQLSECQISGADAGSFSLQTNQPQSVFPGTRSAYVDVSCTRAASAKAATLQCNERRGTNAMPTPRSWNLSCPAGGAITPQTGWYWNAAESGRGYFIENRNGSIFMGGFLYLASGPNWWFVGQGPLNSANNTATLDSPMFALEGGQSLTGIYRASRFVESPGNVKLTFSADDELLMTWPGGQVPLKRFPIFDLVSVKPAQAGAPESGWWWNENETGRGFAIGFEGDAVFIVGFMYDESGRATWYTSNGKMSTPTLYENKWLLVGNGQAIGAPYKPAQVLSDNVGSLRLQFSDSRHATLTLPDGRLVNLTRQPQ